jgi:hypothetical protein
MSNVIRTNPIQVTDTMASGFLPRQMTCKQSPSIEHEIGSRKATQQVLGSGATIATDYWCYRTALLNTSADSCCQFQPLRLRFETTRALMYYWPPAH